MRASAKNRWLGLTSILAIFAAALPDYPLARLGFAFLGIIAVMSVVVVTERSERASAIIHDTEVMNNALEHADLKDLSEAILKNLKAKESDTILAGSLVERVRLAAAQLALFASDERESNRMPNVTIIDADGGLTDQARKAIARWNERGDQSLRTFNGAFRDRIDSLLREAAMRPGVGGLADDARHRITQVATTRDMVEIAGNLNEIAMVVETGKPIR